MTRHFSLLSDDSFVVRVPEELCPIVDAWLPLNRRSVPAMAATILIEVAADPGGHVEGPALLTLGDVVARATDADHVVFTGPGAHAVASLATHVAHVELSTACDVMCASHLLTLISALLLGRMGAVLVHAGAVVDRDGRAWLLAGDTHSGKTTTSVALADAGWRFLADDQVVLRERSGVIVAEGWPRHAHLDTGFDVGVVSSQRDPVDVRDRWQEYSAESAAVAAVLLPAVNAGQPTSLARVSAATALAALIRQSPWLMADRSAAPALLTLLERVARLPAYVLSLGRDSYGNGIHLQSLLRTQGR